MHSMVLYYPKNSIYILDNNEFKEIYTTVTCDRKFCLVDTYSYNKRIYPGIQLALRLKNRDSIIYSELLSALKEINNGKREYIISKEVCDGIISVMNMKSFVDQFNISKYSDYYEYLSTYEKTMLKLINKRMTIVIFIYYRRWCVL